VDEPIRLFLVSPALAIRRALARALDEEAEILVVGEAGAAVDALVRVPAARPHVVLAGAHLHAPDTPEMCRRLLEAMPDVHILVVGVNAGQELVADVMSAGACGVVPHTIDEKELLDAIRTAAAGRMVMSTDAFMEMLRGRADDASDPLENLTPLEREMFDLVGEGMSNAEIAQQLHLSHGTVRNYVSRLLRKLQVDRRAQLVAQAARLNSVGHPSGHDRAPDP
jgi:DNA-binding NarL/FixJ family response regulator